jgi:hypothetical protein
LGFFFDKLNKKRIKCQLLRSKTNKNWFKIEYRTNIGKNTYTNFPHFFRILTQFLGATGGGGGLVRRPTIIGQMRHSTVGGTGSQQQQHMLVKPPQLSTMRPQASRLSACGIKIRRKRNYNL